MTAKAQFINKTIVYGVIVVFGLFLMIFGTRLMGIVGTQLTPILRLPMKYIYLSLPLTGFFYAFLGFYQMYCHVTGTPYVISFQETPQEVMDAAAEALRGKKE
jgi:TRAP-type C4-dicarboxylate transport system permease small subunit